MFYPYAEFVPRFHFFGAQRAAMQLRTFGVTLERKAKRGVTVRGKKPETRTQFAREPDPIFCGEFCRALFRVAFLPDAARFYRIQNLAAQWIIRARKFQSPDFLHLRVTNHAETAKEFSAGFAKFAPGGVRIDFLTYGRKRAAPAERNPEIVDGIFVRRSHHALALFEHALHPIQQTFGFRCLGRKRNNCRHSE